MWMWEKSQQEAGGVGNWTKKNKLLPWCAFAPRVLIDQARAVTGTIAGCDLLLLCVCCTVYGNCEVGATQLHANGCRLGNQRKKEAQIA